MFEQDYIMRLIKEMIRMVLKMLFHMDTESQAAELLEEKEQKETLDRLLDMVDGGNIDKAENELYDLLSQENMGGLEIALLFYSYLNDKDDDFLENQNYSREEIKMGLRAVLSQYGFDGLGEMFLSEI